MSPKPVSKQRLGPGKAKASSGTKRQNEKASQPTETKKRGRHGQKPEELDGLFEAEAPVADEVKNNYRYDNVESYEYELPDNFDDEEIDEEMAFSAEDKIKYAGWFDDDAGAGAGEDYFGDEEEGEGDDEDAEGAGEEEIEADEEVDLLNSDDEPEASHSLKNRPSQGDEEAEADAAGEDEDEDFLDALGVDEDDDEEFEEEDEEAGEDLEDGEGNEERYQAMMTSVTGKVAGKARAAGRLQQQRVISEACPESEFSLNPGAASTGASGELTVEDLMRGLGADGRRKLAPASRKTLDRLATKPSAGKPTKAGRGAAGSASAAVAPLAAPLARPIKERQERKAGYEHTKEEVTKWQSIVKANREAPTLVFKSARGEVGRINTTQAMVAKHTPENALEEEVAALLEAAGAASAMAVQEAEEKLAMKSLTLEEVRARQERLAKMRSLLFHHELKAKRLKAIKSKDYRKRVAKTEKNRVRKLGEAGGPEEDDGGDAERAAEADAEFSRAKERLTLRHRNTSKWARRALKRGIEVMDVGTKEALAEQLRVGQALRRRIEGKVGDADGSSSGDDTSASEGEEAGVDGIASGTQHRGLSGKAKAAALDILAGNAEEDQVPKKGLFSLPFMSRMLQRQRLEAKEAAEEALREDEVGKDGEATDAAPAEVGRMRIGSGSAPFGFEDVPGGDEERDVGLSSDANEDLDGKVERLGRRLTDGVQEDVAAGSGRARVAGAAVVARKDDKQLPRRQQPTREELIDLEVALAGGPAAATMLPGMLAEGAATAAAVAASRRSGSAGASTSSGLPAAHANLFEGRGKPSSQRVSDASASAEDGFIPAPSFSGPKPGYAFKKGARGLGYYLDRTAAVPQPQQAKGKAATVAGSSQPGKTAAAAAARSAAAAEHQQRAKQHQQQRRGLGDGGAGLVDDDDVRVDDVGAGDDEGVDGSRHAEGMRPANTQRDLISMAFAGDDVEADFAAEKAEDVALELPKVEAPSALPGWGMWAGAQREPRWMRDAKEKARRDTEAAANGRTDAKMRNVVISEKWDKKAAKYMASGLPFPHNSKEVYESSIRQPLGREFNPDTSFRNLTRPAVLKTTGVIINPARYGKSTARDAAGGGTVNERGIATVAGGMNLMAKVASEKKTLSGGAGARKTAGGAPASKRRRGAGAAP